MNLTDKITKFQIDATGNLVVKDNEGRTFSPAIPLAENYAQSDIIQVRGKEITASVSLQTEFVNITSIQADILDVSNAQILELYVDIDARFFIKISGEHSINYGSVILTGTSGFNINVNREHPIYQKTIGSGYTLYELYSYPETGTWNGAGTAKLFKGYFIETEIPHNFSANPAILIKNLTGFTSINNVARDGLVIDSNTLYIEYGLVTGIRYSSSSYSGQSAKIQKNNIARLAFDTTDFIDETVTFTYASPLMVTNAHGTTALYGINLNVINKTSTYIDVDLTAYYTAIPTTSITFISNTKIFAPSIITGETVELVFKNGKRKRFFSITDALKEYEEGQIRVYAKETAYSEGDLGINQHLNMYVEANANIDSLISVELNKNIIIEGKGTFKKIINPSQSTGFIYIEGRLFRSIRINSSQDAYVNVNEILPTDSSLPFSFNYETNVNFDNKLFFNFNKIISVANSAVQVHGNAYITGNYIETSLLGHCLIVHGSNNSKCFAKIKHLKSIINDVGGSGKFAEAVTLEDVGGADDYQKELNLDFDLIEIQTGLATWKVPAVRNLNGVLNLKNGVIKSNSDCPAVVIHSVAGGSIRNVKIENTNGPALDISNYYVSPYLMPIEVIDCQIIGNSTDGAVGLGYIHESSWFGAPTDSGCKTNAKISNSDIRNTNNNASSCGIKIGNNSLSMELDNVSIITAHASAKSIDKFAMAITAITKAAQAVITAIGHQIYTGQTVKILGVVGMTELNGNTYTITSVGANTITINVNSTGFTTYVSGGTVSVMQDLKIKKPCYVKVDKESNYLTLTENSTALNVVANLT